MGLLWPNFMATFGERLRARLRARGLLVLPRGDLHRHLRLRLGPAVAADALPVSGIPIVIAGFTGSLMVISVNAWMNHPSGFRLAAARSVDVHPVDGAVRQLLPVARARPHVPRRRTSSPGSSSPAPTPWAGCAAARGRYERTALVDPADDRRAGRAGADRGRRLGRARGRRRPAGQARRARGPRRRRPRARPMHLARLVRRTARSSTGSRSRRLLSLLAFHDPNATVQGLDTVPAGRAPAGQRRPRRVPDDGRHRHAARAARRLSTWYLAAAPAAAAHRAGSTARWSPPGRCRSWR